MRIKDTSSRDPEDLVEKFNIREEDAWKYVPTEEKTLVVNFSEHWIYGVRTADPKQFSPFKKGLKSQFGLISYDITRCKELITYLWTEFYKLRKDTKRTVYLSHPSFFKSSFSRDESVPLELHNVALRFPMKEHDLVLSGDFMSYDDRGLERIEYIVKGLSVMNKASHYGEVKVTAGLMLRVVNSSIRCFYTTDGKLAEGRPGDVYGNSIINSGIITELNETFVVKDPLRALKVLNDWSDYLTSERRTADMNSIQGYGVSRPEFFTAVPKQRESASEKDILFVTPENCWVRSSGFDQDSHVIVKISHRAAPRLFENDPYYVEKFNTFADMGVRIVDPLERKDRSKEEIERQKRMCRISDSKLVTVVTGAGASPARKTLLKARDRELAREDAGYRKELAAAVYEEMEAYTAPDDLPETEDLTDKSPEELSSILNETIDKFAAVTVPLNKALHKHIKKLDMTEEEASETLDKEVLSMFRDYRSYTEEIERCRNLGSTVPEELTEAIGEISASYRKAEARETYRRIKTAEVSGRLSAGHRERCIAIKEKFLKDMESLARSEGDTVITVYFEVPVKARSPVLEADERNRYFSHTSSYRLVSDLTGTQTSIARLRDSLESFKRGEVSNPYLASYLFSTDGGRVSSFEPVKHYFGSGFNDEQKKAINEALNCDGIYMIQGPPGTGKTQVISEITAQEVLRGRKVLITSQNNKAIDNAFERLLKNPLIRPMRMMSEGKVSYYDVDNNLSVFYRNISSTLKEQLPLYSDPEVKEELKAGLDRISELYEAYQDRKEDAEDVLLDISEDKEDLAAENQKLEDFKRRSEERVNKIALVKERLKTSGDFEQFTYNVCARDIKDLFRGSISVSSRETAESEIEGKVFGKYGYCSALVNMPDEEFEIQNENLQANGAYRQLYITLCRTEDAEAKTDIQERMDSYLLDKGLDRDSFKLLEIFGEDLPDNLPEIRDRLQRMQMNVEYQLNCKLEEYSSSKEEVLDEKKILKEIGFITDELEEFEEDEKYIAFADAEKKLSNPMQDMLQKLGISVNLKDMSEAYDALKTRVEMICSMSDSETGMVQGAISKVISHLEEENDDESEKNIDLRLIDYMNVFGVTCTANGFVSVKGDDEEGKGIYLDVATMGIDVVIIDEVSKVPFSELLRPILSGKTIILVGDHKQLPPVYNVKYDKQNVSSDDPVALREEAFKKMYTESFFQKMFENSPEGCKTMLKTQYRMASQIMGAINRFYGGQLEMGCTDEQKKHGLTVVSKGKTILSPGTSVLFVDCKGKDVLRKGSTSYENEMEADVVVKLTELLEDNCVSDKNGNPVSESEDTDKLSIGVITPYSAQARLIKKRTDRLFSGMKRSGRASAFRSEGEERFMVKSVDDFQGDERDIIILSLVRTTRSAFISDYRRINVAMSRARRLLVIVGNEESLSNEEIDLDGKGDMHHVYSEIIEDIRKNGGYIEAGDIIGREE